MSEQAKCMFSQAKYTFVQAELIFYVGGLDVFTR